MGWPTMNGANDRVTSFRIIQSAFILKGEIDTRLDQYGNHKSTNVPAEGLLFAMQVAGSSPSITWTQRNPHGVTEISSAGPVVYDPLGNYIPFQFPADPRPPVGTYGSSSSTGPALHLANPDNY